MEAGQGSQDEASALQLLHEATAEMQDEEPDAADANTLTLIHTVIDTKTSERGEVKVDLNAAKRAATTALSGILVPASVSASPITSGVIRPSSATQQATSSSAAGSSGSNQAAAQVVQAGASKPRSSSTLPPIAAADTRHAALLTMKAPGARRNAQSADTLPMGSVLPAPLVVLNSQGGPMVVRSAAQPNPTAGMQLGRAQSNSGMTYVLPSQQSDPTIIYQQLTTPPNNAQLQQAQQQLMWETNNAGYQGTLISHGSATGTPFTGMTLQAQQQHANAQLSQELHLHEHLLHHSIPITTVLNHGHDTGLVNQQQLLQVTQVQPPQQVQVQQPRSGAYVVQVPAQTTHVTRQEGMLQDTAMLAGHRPVHVMHVNPAQLQQQQPLFLSQPGHAGLSQVADLHADLVAVSSLSGAQIPSQDPQSLQHVLQTNHVTPLLGHRLLSRSFQRDIQLMAAQQESLLMATQHDSQPMQAQQGSQSAPNQGFAADMMQLPPPMRRMLHSATPPASSSPVSDLAAAQHGQVRPPKPRSAGSVGSVRPVTTTGVGLVGNATPQLVTHLSGGQASLQTLDSSSSGMDATLDGAYVDFNSAQERPVSMSALGPHACPLAAFQLACTQATFTAQQPESDLTLDQLHAEHQHLLALLGVLLRHVEGASSAAICVELLMLVASIKSQLMQYKSFSPGAQIGFQLAAATLAHMGHANAPAELRHAASVLQPLLSKTAEPGSASSSLADPAAAAGMTPGLTKDAPTPLSLPKLRSLAMMTNRHLMHLGSIISKRTVTRCASHHEEASTSQAVAAAQAGLANSQGNMWRGSVSGLAPQGVSGLAGLGSRPASSGTIPAAAWWQMKKISRSANARGIMQPGLLYPAMSDVVENEEEGLLSFGEPARTLATLDNPGVDLGSEQEQLQLHQATDAWGGVTQELQQPQQPQQQQYVLGYESQSLQQQQQQQAQLSPWQCSSDEWAKAMRGQWATRGGPALSESNSALSVFSPALSCASRPGSTITWAALDSGSHRSFPSQSIPSIASVTSQNVLRGPGPSSSYANMSRLSSMDLAPFSQWGTSLTHAGWDLNMPDGLCPSPTAANSGRLPESSPGTAAAAAHQSGSNTAPMTGWPQHPVLETCVSGSLNIIHGGHSVQPCAADQASNRPLVTRLSHLSSRNSVDADMGSISGYELQPSVLGTRLSARPASVNTITTQAGVRPTRLSKSDDVITEATQPAYPGVSEPTGLMELPPHPPSAAPTVFHAQGATSAHDLARGLPPFLDSSPAGEGDRSDEAAVLAALKQRVQDLTL